MALVAVALLGAVVVVVLIAKRRPRYVYRPQPRRKTTAPKGKWLGVWAMASLMWALFVVVGYLTKRPVFFGVSLALFALRLWRGFRAQQRFNTKLLAVSTALPPLTRARLAAGMANYSLRDALQTVGELPRTELTQSLHLLAQTASESAEQEWIEAFRRALNTSEVVAAVLNRRLSLVQRRVAEIAFVTFVGSAFFAGAILFLNKFITPVAEGLAIIMMVALAGHNYLVDRVLD